ATRPSHCGRIVHGGVVCRFRERSAVYSYLEPRIRLTHTVAMLPFVLDVWSDPGTGALVLQPSRSFERAVGVLPPGLASIRRRPRLRHGPLPRKEAEW